MTSPGAQPARLLLRHTRAGVLGTHSTRFPGYPAGSAVPFATDAGGAPVILISDLAAHARNIAQDPRVSVTLHGDDVVGGPRLTLLGDAVPIDSTDPAAQRYLAILPEAATFAGFGDFHFHRIAPVAVHYIGGFADIRWFDGPDLLLPPGALDTAAPDVLQHMNEDHIRALSDYCRHVFGVEEPEPRLVAIDGDGFDVRAAARVLRFDFSAIVPDAETARAEFVRLARQSRAT